MDVIQVKDYVDYLGVKIPSISKFWELGDSTALRVRKDGTFFRSNYERGILLYALVAKHRPKNVLEFGTGRGYGSLCMAWAMSDFGIDGTVNTIDMVSSYEAIRWPIIRDGSDPSVQYLSRMEVWDDVGELQWINRINSLKGLSGSVMKSFDLDKIDFAFIDGGHGYRSVLHDFIITLMNSGERIGILFDDYSAEDWGIGTQKLVAKYVLPYLEAKLVQTDRRWVGGEKENIREDGVGMVWVETGDSDEWLVNIESKFSFVPFLTGYRIWENYYRIRLKLSKTIRGFISFIRKAL